MESKSIDYKISKTKCIDPIFEDEPERSSFFIVNCQEPFNAEAPVEMLIESQITPTPLFLKRNHSAIPNFLERDYCFTIDGLVEYPVTISMEMLKKSFKKYEIESLVYCAGNRRGELNSISEVDGVTWGGGALGNAIWGGALLKDVLELACPFKNSKHVEFIGGDVDYKLKIGYGSSIPIEKATDLYGEVLVCYEMNKEVLTRDHGFPVRIIVPGYIGARSVKWLKKIIVRENESENYYQSRDYKLFLPKISKDKITAEDWDQAESIGSLNVNSFICNLKTGDTITKYPFKVRGYATSNGAKIWRVDYSLNNGKTWDYAKIFDPSASNSNLNRNWGWTFWEFEIVEPAETSKTNILVRAWDQNSSTQPDKIESIWNYRGLMNNSIQNIEVYLAKESDSLAKF